MRTLLSILPLVIFAAGCGNQGTIEVDVGSTSQALTSVPVEPSEPTLAQRELRTSITRVDVHVVEAGRDARGNEAAGRASDGWTTIFEGAQEINLLDTASAVRSLGSVQAPIGKVTQVRLFMNDVANLVDEQGSRNITCPSCSETGLKLVTAAQLEVEADGILRLTLDFDADASLVESDSGTVLRPVVRVHAVNE